MVFLRPRGLVLLAITSCSAQLYEPEAVKQDVSSMLSQFSRYTDYPGPTGTVSNVPRPTHIINPTPQGAASCDYWLDDIKHQGIAAFNPHASTYQVYRNVKTDFGAKGDGVTDDTVAINNAISSGGRCGPGTCSGSTITPAIVYFPPGTYMVNDSIIDYYFTQLIGNPNCLPTIKPFPRFHGGFGVIDGDQYQAGNVEGFGQTNVFWRQIRNFIIDLTNIPYTSGVTGIHWPTSQATSIQNVIFKMSEAKGTQHQGIFIEGGSGGFLTDLVFYGGGNAAVFGNQQFTMRNLTFYNAVTAIDQIWDWGWTYSGITVNNCTTGLNMSNGGAAAETVGSVTLFDSSFVNTKVAVLTAYTSNSQPPAGNSLILENIAITNVPIVVKGGDGKTDLAGSTGSQTIAGWGEGHSYTPNGPNTFQGAITPVSRPASLITGGKYYTRSKPQYQNVNVTSFLSARSQGAKGDGKTDDTKALQSAINNAVKANQILYLDQGDYLVTSTIYIPAGSKIVGEAYPVILSGGAFFNNIASPQPVVQIGKPGEKGSVEWSDTLVSTRGAQAGAILIQYNLAAPAGTPTGLWDVHTRIGGFKGSNLEVTQCPTTPGTTVTSANLKKACIAAFMSMHITTGAAGLYLENVWLWTADHDVDTAGQTQITIYTGRGLLDESTNGPVWMWGTAVEHHALAQYQFINTKNVFAGQIQTETPYYQPNPSAPLPFPYNASYSDPQFGLTKVQVDNKSIPNADAWGLRIIGASTANIRIYGAGHYSFFNNYSTQCSNQTHDEICQTHLLDLDPKAVAYSIYNLNTVGTHYAFANGNTKANNNGL